ncbi:MAG: hypothetical protein JWO56_2816 [Acidobacteria bacterium]|nr:hypothetical protein [Acidobacteriota bacterium]
MPAPLDLEGLQVAYLGTALAHYLDLLTGDIIDLPLDALPPGGPLRFKRIPTRTDESEAEDRRIFVEKHPQFAGAIDDAREFRRLLSDDRLVERAFFNFKNDRATIAIGEWLREIGVT